MSDKSNNNLIYSIIFATLLITGSLVFLGLQMGGSKGGELSQEDLGAAMEKYAQEQQKKSQQAQIEKEKAQQEMAQKNLKKETDGEYVRGNPDAPVTIIEYSDFECPYCKRFHNTMKEVMEEYKEQVNWVYRHFPLGFHDPLATQEAAAVECVGDIAGGDKFWEYTDLVYETTKSNGGLDANQLPVLAQQIGVDVGAFNECYESEKFVAKVKKDMAEGAKAGVTGTPGSFIVNNKTGDISFVPGALPFAQIKGQIDQMLQ